MSIRDRINTADTRSSRFTGGERIDCAIAELDIKKRKVVLSIKLLEEIEKKEAKLSSAEGNPYGDNYEIYINPQIDLTNNKSTKIDEEGCLSIPGLMVERKRFDEIKVRYYDANGKKNKKRLSGFLSKLFQHELDHLNGMLMIDGQEKIENLYPLEASEEQAKLYGTLYSQYQKLIK